MTELLEQKQTLLERVAMLSNLEDVQHLNLLLDAMQNSTVSAEPEIDFLLALAQKGRAQVANEQVGGWADAQAAMKKGREKGLALRKQRQENA